MDSNLQRPYQLSDREHWSELGGTQLECVRRMLRLRSTRVPTWVEDRAAGEARVAAAPGAIDRYGTRARVDKIADGAVRWRVMATGATAGEVAIVAPQTDEITDIAIGEDDVLYVAIGDRVRFHDLRGRWPDFDLPVPRAWRLAAAPGAGVYVLAGSDAGAQLGRITGAPPFPPLGQYAGSVFRPVHEEPHPPAYTPLPVAVPAGVKAAAIATGPRGRLALLAWNGTSDAELFLLGDRAWSPPHTLQGVARPYSLRWVDDDHVAVLLALSASDSFAAVYALGDQGEPLRPVGDPYPLRRPTTEPLLHGTTLPPRYATSDGEPRALIPISWPSYAVSGEIAARQSLDGLRPGTVWHRIYLEAAIPPGTSVRVLLGASELPRQQPATWFEHRFGDARDAAPEVPLGTWIDAASEMPFHDGLLACPRKPGIAGLFTALIQRGGADRMAVRSLSGRFLWVRVQLVGDGRSTPEVAAVRAYADRHGYAGAYLPLLYREDTFGLAADAPGRATPADYLDRFLGMFESVLTPLEDKIASAWLLTTPRAVPAESLDWLASWLGLVFAADLPIARRRCMLENAFQLYQERGTLAGLRRALDIATGGDVGRGEIVVVEDFRLRRTFATILGAELSDPDDPLTQQLDVSANSLVGDTLFLGDEDRRGFLALFAPDLPIGTADQIATDEAAVADRFDRLAHRATVLVHQEVEDQDLGLIRQIIELEAPAHVEVKVVTATYRFRVAASALIGVDTFLAPRPPPGPVILDRSQVGMRDLIQRLPSLDPRLGRTS